MNKYWTEQYIDFQSTFDIEVKIPASKENIVDIIIDIDKFILFNGYKYKIFDIFDHNHLDITSILESYEKIKRAEYTKPEYYYINNSNAYTLPFFLLDFNPNLSNNCSFFNLEKCRLNFEFIKIDLENDITNYKKSRELNSIFEITPYDFISISEFTDSNFFLTLNLSSNSNIWFDEIKLTYVNNRKEYFSPPVSNRYFSYQISPMYNSFLRALYSKINYLNGVIKLHEQNIDNVNNLGFIVLDNQIIFQEDIESGKVKYSHSIMDKYV